MERDTKFRGKIACDDISLRKTEVENNPDFWELTTGQINNTTKDKYIERKIGDIKKSIKKYGYDKISTCNSFSYGWSKEDYLYMDDVASKLRQIGVTVRKEMKFGVMDYYFT